MMDSVGRLLVWMVSGAFIFGAWSSTLEFRTQAHSEKLSSHDVKISTIEDRYQADQKFLIDVLGRMDERLKNIERKP